MEEPLPNSTGIGGQMKDQMVRMAAIEPLRTFLLQTRESMAIVEPMQESSE